MSVRVTRCIVNQRERGAGCKIATVRFSTVPNSDGYLLGRIFLRKYSIVRTSVMQYDLIDSGVGQVAQQHGDGRMMLNWIWFVPRTEQYERPSH